MQNKVVIRAGQNSRYYWKELWQRRELVYMLAQRDFLLRFKQTYLGLAWVLFRPTMLMLVLLFVFGKISGLATQTTVPYALIVLTGLIPWQYFAQASHEVARSLQNNHHIVSKTYFPRLALPISAMAAHSADFLLSFILLLACYTWYGYTPGWQIVAMPLFLGVLAMLIAGTGIWVASLSVRFRDSLLLLPFILQIGLYISPVGYKAGSVPEEYWWLYNLNPLVGILEGFRWSLLNGEGGFHWKSLTGSFIMASILLVTGLMHFRKTEKTIADIL